MNCFTIDLYQYFGIDRPQGSAGRLAAYIQSTTPDTNFRRLRPAVLVIPGGGYAHVSPREGEPIALRYLSQGYCAFVLDYSVAPLEFPHCLREAAMAMKYIRINSQELGIDPSMVAAIGFSAGGHLCGMLGTMFDCEEVSQIGDPQQIRPDVIGLCYPVAISWGVTHGGSFENLCGKDQALRDRLSLEKLVRADMPAVHLWHTRDDTCVPCRNSLILGCALEEAGIDMVLHLYRHGQHGLSTADQQVYVSHGIPDISNGVSGWLDSQIAFFREKGLFVRDMMA